MFKEEEGIGLIELLVSIVVVAIVGSSILAAMLQMSSKLDKQDYSDSVKSYYLAQQVMEYKEANNDKCLDSCNSNYCSYENMSYSNSNSAKNTNKCVLAIKSDKGDIWKFSFNIQTSSGNGN